MDIKRIKINPRLVLVIHKYKGKFLGLLMDVVREKSNVLGEKITELVRQPQVVFRAIHKKLPDTLKQKIKEWEWLQSKAYELGWVTRGARCYIKAGLDKVQFAKELEKRGVEYVLLRWWENFPEFPDDEDMDILMFPSGFEKIQDLISYRKNKNKCDIYLHNGERPGHWNHLPYYPDYLFRQTIKTAKLYKGMVRVPDAFHHFSTMSYHALYHKGQKSGVKGFENTPESLEHDYDNILKVLVEKIEEPLESIDVNSIHQFLTENRFAPASDTLSKLADINPELEFLLPDSDTCKSDDSSGEYAVYLVREKAMEHKLLDTFLEVFQSKKFDILDVTHLNADQKLVAANELRGGKWDSAGYELKAGGPVVAVTVLDYHPVEPGLSLKKKYRWLTNANVLKAKRECRKMLWRKHWFKYYNPIHCADSESEALEYLETLFEKQEVDRLIERVEEKKKNYYTRYPVIQLLSKGRRSKVELIKYNHQKAVKKTFRIGAEKFFEREVQTLRLFQNEFFCPEILEVGECYYVVKYYPSVIDYNSASDIKRKLGKYRNQIISIMKKMYDNNLAYINFTPENVLLTEAGELKAIDFEFVQRYSGEKPKTFEHAYEVKGVPEDFDGDLPSGYDYGNSSFSIVWQYYLGKF